MLKEPASWGLVIAVIGVVITITIQDVAFIRELHFPWHKSGLRANNTKF